MNDFRVMNHGSIVMVEPISQAAQEWVEEKVSTDCWQWFGGAFACEPRMVQSLVDGIEAAGLEVS